MKQKKSISLLRSGWMALAGTVSAAELYPAADGAHLKAGHAAVLYPAECIRH